MDLRTHLAQRLPDVMVPSFYHFSEALPLNPNGKVDRLALSHLSLPDQNHDFVGQAFVAPRDRFEHGLARIWEEVLQLPAVGIFDNFFELGGHSLLSARLLGHIRRQFGVKLPLSALFRNPTIAALAASLRSESSGENRSPLIGLRTSGSRTPLFLVHPLMGNHFPICPLGHHVGPGTTPLRVPVPGH